MNFRFAPDIFVRLGEELNPSPSRGIIELVRNSYDADATVCSVEFTYANKQNCIEIKDNGDGMTQADIQNGWFVLGKSRKTRTLTRLGRVPVGDKGLGRLAALRLGRRVEVITRSRENPHSQLEFRIDWDKYHGAQTIDQIGFDISAKSVSDLAPGTEIRIIDLHVEFARRDIKNLAREMVLLADAFGGDPLGFMPSLRAVEFKEFEKLVARRYFEHAEYVLRCSVDEAGYAAANVADYHGNTLFEAKHDLIAQRRGGRIYECPKFSFELWVFLLQDERFIGRPISKGDLKEWLTAFGGVHIYQNGIRIAPYGDEGNDWLGMNLLRARSPELVPSTNTSIGRVAIFDHNNVLVQKTDRHGFIETAQFVDIKNACVDVIRWMQNRRVELRRAKLKEEESKEKVQIDARRKTIEEEINSLPKAKKLKMMRLFRDYERKRDKKERDLRKEVQLNRTLSTAGISATLFAHDSSKNPVQLIKSNTRTVKRRAQELLSAKKYESELSRPIERVLASSEALSVLSSFTLELVNSRKRRTEKVYVHRVTQDVVDQFRPFLSARKIECVLNLCAGEPYLNGSVASIEAILTNLLANAVQAFEKYSVQQRKIVVKTIFEGDKYLQVAVFDNGPGIVGIDIDDIWVPGETTRKNGTGLGLAIVKDSVTDLGGVVSAHSNSELGGAKIIATLPVIGA